MCVRETPNCQGFCVVGCLFVRETPASKRLYIFVMGTNQHFGVNSFLCVSVLRRHLLPKSLCLCVGVALASQCHYDGMCKVLCGKHVGWGDTSFLGSPYTCDLGCRGDT